MGLCNLHTHTTYCDGNNTPMELVEKAIKIGFDTLGFSGHSYTFFDQRYCMSKSGTKAYKKEISSLKEIYKERLNVLLGIEQDFYSDEPTTGYDYIIGAVHYILKNGTYIPVDDDIETLEKAVIEYYSGDIYALIEDYYATLGLLIEKTGADIIAHFDLIKKFNNNNRLFNPENGRYIAAYKKAADMLLCHNKIFEINTGAIARGYTDYPYPSKDIYDYIKQKGGRFILTSDCHNKDKLNIDFSKYDYLIEKK